MFRGMKAWFSQSVDSSLIQIWESEGGVTTTHHHANYLFSSDAAHHDTQRIYNSLDYVENKATVFHASFLKTSARSKASNTMALGHFILPPACLHEEIRREIGNFIWEQDDTQQKKQDGKTLSGAEENDHRNPECDLRNKDLMSDNGSSDEGICHTFPNFPGNNMHTGYISIDQLKKFPGELHDFTPDSSEYFVYSI
ncbi:telomere repeats-binding bouquet formation protein 2 [Rana temporaria]|uniref:telomere repeats-binding bouquet formation protein 2 n=1 Tax=Rana temporaria TaxID=8407 RepID=UPI001AAD6A35|nr:telomere repeats-binding bouquet formation protein 2 [Rana temporaria]